MEETMTAYFACAVQGEGNISLVKRKDKRTDKGFYYEPRIEITNCELEWLQFLRSKVNLGYMHKDDSPSKTCNGRNYNISYRLIICAIDDLYGLLQILHPYLIGRKKLLASLLIKYIQLRKCQPKNRVNYSMEMIKIYEEMKKLNRRGRKQLE